MQLGYVEAGFMGVLLRYDTGRATEKGKFHPKTHEHLGELPFTPADYSPHAWIFFSALPALMINTHICCSRSTETLPAAAVEGSPL